ncbi:MAG: DoxX family protein [Isosphaeraceae bacterium]
MSIARGQRIRGRSTPLSASRRSYYYPGFLGAFLLVALRVVIGWHFAYEGLWKLESWTRGDKPFSAEGYLKNATGPLAPYFRGMLPDVNGLATLDPSRLEASWKSDVEHIADHFGFNDSQRAKANELLQQSQTFAADWFRDRENREKRSKYYHDLAVVQGIEKSTTALTNEREWAWAQRKTLDSDRKALTKELDERTAGLRDSVVKIADPQQLASAGTYRPTPTLLDVNNALTVFSLIAIGFCLMAGLLSRFAALGGAVFLGMIYMCMPPWPGLPANPLAEGHFAYVDKNLVELVALLALASLPTSQWIGLDALLFGWWARRREAARSRAVTSSETARESGRRVQTVS